MTTNIHEKKLLFKIRSLITFFILALVASGITAFPIETEMRVACQILNISLDVPPDTYDGLKEWIATVAVGVVNTNEAYPFLSYGYDWLAFSHLVIAVAFIGLYRKPIRNKWIVHFGMIACVGVIPLALICGAIRDIPFWWRMIDCSFGFFGIIPLLFLHVYITRLEKAIGYVPSKYE